MSTLANKNSFNSSTNSSTSSMHMLHNSGNLETNTGVYNQATKATNIIEQEHTPGDGIPTVPENNSSSSPQYL